MFLIAVCDYVGRESSAKKKKVTFFIVLKQRQQCQIKGNKCGKENFKATSHLNEKGLHRSL